MFKSLAMVIERLQIFRVYQTSYSAILVRTFLSSLRIQLIHGA